MAWGARCTHDGLSGHIVGVHVRGQVGIFAEEIVTTDTLGRRTGPRTRHTNEEKLRIAGFLVLDPGDFSGLSPP
jgi:hypothetical protein